LYANKLTKDLLLTKILVHLHEAPLWG